MVAQRMTFSIERDKGVVDFEEEAPFPPPPKKKKNGTATYEVFRRLSTVQVVVVNHWANGVATLGEVKKKPESSSPAEHH